MIKQDLTGYIARYNADWARAAQLWRQAFGPKSVPEKKCGFNQYETFSGCQDATTQWECKHLVKGSVCL